MDTPSFNPRQSLKQVVTQAKMAAIQPLDCISCMGILPQNKLEKYLLRPLKLKNLEREKSYFLKNERIKIKKRPCNQLATLCKPGKANNKEQIIRIDQISRAVPEKITQPR